MRGRADRLVKPTVQLCQRNRIITSRIGQIGLQTKQEIDLG